MWVERECVALIGESGSGKTTLLRCFNRLVDPDEGRVLVDGVDAAELDPIALRRRIGYVPQDGGLLPHWRVQRNVELVPWLRGMKNSGELAVRALGLVGLEPAVFADRWPRELSGGQRQRVAVARALAASPDVILLDEPFGALDAITRADLQVAFDGIRRELKISAVLVTHDLNEAFLLADRIVVMRQGRVEQDASPTQLREAPATEYVRQLLLRGASAGGMSRRRAMRLLALLAGISTLAGPRALPSGRSWWRRSRSASRSCWRRCSPSCWRPGTSRWTGGSGSAPPRSRSGPFEPTPSTSTRSTPEPDCLPYWVSVPVPTRGRSIAR